MFGCRRLRSGQDTLWQFMVRLMTYGMARSVGVIPCLLGLVPGIALLTATCAAGPSAEGLTKHDRPNVVLIVADDLGYADVGFHGCRDIQTPHLDHLAATGTVCSQGYVSSAVCSPSRAGLLTGRNQVTFGYDNNLSHTRGFDPEFAGLPVDQKTMADHLAAAGYRTGIIGKWHLGGLPQFHPTRRGFDEFWGFTGGGHQYFPTPPGSGYQAPIECNFKRPQPITYLTDDIGDEAVGFIKRNREQPFFLYVAFNAPHTPMQATEADLEIYSGIADQKRRTYAAMVHRLDVNVGNIQNALRNAGVARKTITVFVSDNGGPLRTNASRNEPLRGQKGILTEGGMRVPFVIHDPVRLPKSQRYDHPVSSLDLLPTFLAAAEAQPVDKSPKFDGVDLWPYLTGQNAGPPHDTLRWRFTISAAIRQGPWKLIRLPDRLPMLFNLDQDVSESNDVALGNIERTRRMLSDLGTWDVQLPPPLFLEGKVWKSRQLSLYDTDQ